jgi:hypothetical protein
MTVEEKFRDVLLECFDRWTAAFTFEHIQASLRSSDFIVTDVKNIRCSSKDGRRRVTASLTLLRTPKFDKPVQVKYLLTYNGRVYKADLRMVK